MELEKLSDEVMTLCLQALVSKTNWLGVINILLITQAKLSFKKKKKIEINIWEIRPCSTLS